jgi:predicted DNA-binding transcriptional regulator YafY
LNKLFALCRITETAGLKIMDRFDQIYRIHRLLKGRRTALTRIWLEGEFDVSRATVTRLIAFCRDTLRMPIEFDREKGGYVYTEAERERFELPGLWFNRSELLALLTSHRLLADVQPGVLQPFIAPLQERIEQLLRHKRAGNKDVFKRIRILPLGNRVSRLEDFQKITDALVNRQQLRIVYSSRGKDEVTERRISPQRLVYYRDNWYVDGWCHLRRGLRTFSLDAMQVLEAGETAKDVPDQELDAHVTRTYGIFSGSATGKAVIHFSSDAARWVADELWHPDQESTHLADGRWELVVPYGNPTELIRDILKYGPDAEVIAPAELRVQVAEKLSLALRKYRRIKKV